LSAARLRFFRNRRNRLWKVRNDKLSMGYDRIYLNEFACDAPLAKDRLEIHIPGGLFFCLHQLSHLIRLLCKSHQDLVAKDLSWIDYSWKAVSALGWSGKRWVARLKRGV
jgi:hypothetical protein